MPTTTVLTLATILTGLPVAYVLAVLFVGGLIRIDRHAAAEYKAERRASRTGV